MDRTVARITALTIIASLAPWPAASADLGTPKGPVVLTVTGDIAHANDGAAARFDRAMLRALPVTRYETGTIWTEGTHVFEGVLLATLLEAVGADGDEVRATALNDYAITIPVDGGDEDAALIAFHMDGEEMSVRDKGPLWIVYPYDSSPAYRTEVTYSRSIWQLDRIDVRN